jgi:hypothetical protein
MRLLRCLIFIALDRDLALIGSDRNQALLLSVCVACNETVGHLQNRGGAAEVLFQLHDDRLRPVLLERQDVANVRSPPTVDRLVRITCRADIAVP